MSALPQQLVNPFKQASLGAEYRGELSFDGMPRLQALLVAESGGSVNYRLRFSQPQSRKFCLEGTIEAVVELPCQRCFRSSQHEIASGFRFALVESDAEIALVAEGWEPLLVDEERISLVALLEEELLLSLPAVATHHDKALCAGSDWQSWIEREADRKLKADNAEEENPFAVLADLKKK